MSLKISSIFICSALAFIGLGLIAFGTGGIKPCVASFGGEQFVLPEQAHMMGSYFSMYVRGRRS